MIRTVQIDKLAFGGEGFGFLDGKACFVPFTAPGDLAGIRVVQEKSSYCRGELVSLVTPSVDRISPPCPVFGECGGCNWQFISYDRQLWWKGEIFAELLRRIARIGRDVVLPIVPAPQQYGYRARVQLKVRYAQGAIQMGFYRPGSHYVVNIPDHCPLAHEAINRALPEIRQMLRTVPEPDKIPQVDLVTGEDGQTSATVHYIGTRHDELRRILLDIYPSLANIHGLLVQSGRKNTLETVCGCQSLAYGLSAEGDELSLSFSAGGFSQVNYAVNRLLVSMTHEEADQGKNVLDLYCGNGNFSIPLARKCGSIVGVEDNDRSVQDARRNAEKLGRPEIDYRRGDAVEAVQGFVAQGRHFDLVILDPPRTGGAGLVKLLPRLRPATILYVSCDPSTLARDLAMLQKDGYLVSRTRPVDMFPQTYHMESITVLKAT